MFIGYNVKNAIKRASCLDKLNISYKPIGGCFDHLIYSCLDSMGHQLTIPYSSKSKMDGHYVINNLSDGFNLSISFENKDSQNRLLNKIPHIRLIDQVSNFDTDFINELNTNEYILCLNPKNYEIIKKHSKHPNVFFLFPNPYGILQNFENHYESKDTDITILHSDTQSNKIQAIINSIKELDPSLVVTECHNYDTDSIINALQKTRGILQLDDNKNTNYVYANYFACISFTTVEKESTKNSIFYTPDTKTVVDSMKQMNANYLDIFKKISIDKNRLLLQNNNFMKDLQTLLIEVNKRIVSYA
jgi:hypothetical protein